MSLKEEMDSRMSPTLGPIHLIVHKSSRTSSASIFKISRALRQI